MGGNFECSFRLRVTTPGAGWVLGVARYSEGILEWFRFFSYSPRPKLTFLRGDSGCSRPVIRIPVEAVALNADQTVVRVASPEASRHRLGAGDERRLADRLAQLAGGRTARAYAGSTAESLSIR